MQNFEFVTNMHKHSIPEIATQTPYVSKKMEEINYSACTYSETAQILAILTMQANSDTNPDFACDDSAALLGKAEDLLMQATLLYAKVAAQESKATGTIC